VLRSPTDRLIDLKEKMEEYIANGARLGWLLDPRDKRVYVYTPGCDVETVDGLLTISGEPVLPGFTLDLRQIWLSRL
jgi:Uma2 family endonuclease